MRAFVHQLFRQGKNVVVLLAAHQVLEMLDARRRVHLLRDDQRLGIKIERNGCVGARSRGNRFHLSLRWLNARDCIDYGFEMLGRSSAASADDAHAVVLDKMLVVLSKFLRR